MAALSISHSINAPTSEPSPSEGSVRPPASDSFTYALDSSSPLTHLDSLQLALGHARADLNDRLTEWKDLLKHVEKDDKAKHRSHKTGDDDDDDDDQLDEE
ncbi:hypothetical protein JCM11491_004495 [Sporobolomyces phaffii]